MNVTELEKRNKILEKRWKILAVIIAIFVLTRPFAYGVVNNLINSAKENSCESKFMYVNKSVVCNPPVIEKSDYAATQNEISQYIEQEKKDNRITEAAVYFRDLQSGPIFGVNELTEFAPASLLKVPLALVYFRKAESDEQILQQKLSFPPDPPWGMVGQTFAPSQKIYPNTPYTVMQLLEHMVKYSDNDAYGTLEAYLHETGQEELINKTFLELGILAPENIYDQVVDVRRYAGIYRALYNASILSPEVSEKILTWLIEAEFEAGLKSGVPEGIKIANKFGERILSDGTKQLHDCGIIYYQDNPYLLCVMTKGTDFESMAKVIAEVSKQVYGEVDSRKK